MSPIYFTVKGRIYYKTSSSNGPFVKISLVNPASRDFYRNKQTKIMKESCEIMRVMILAKMLQQLQLAGVSIIAYASVKKCYVFEQ